MRYTKGSLIYTLEEDFQCDTYTKGCRRKNDYAQLYPKGLLKIKKGYSWNGCSPKFVIFSMVFGTPEGAVIDGNSQTRKASLVHDAMYQLKAGKRKDADRIFYRYMREANFKPAWIYYLAVRLFGGNAWKT